MNEAIGWFTAAAFAVGMGLSWWQTRRRLRQQLRERLRQEVIEEVRRQWRETRHPKAESNLQTPSEPAQS